MPYDTIEECLTDNPDYPEMCDEEGTVIESFGGRRWPGRSSRRRRRKSRRKSKRRKSRKKKRRRKRKRTKKKRRKRRR